MQTLENVPGWKAGCSDKLPIRFAEGWVETYGANAPSRAAFPLYLYMMRQKGISAEIRLELAGHSLETTMRYRSPKRQEIERAVRALDEAATI